MIPRLIEGLTAVIFAGLTLVSAIFMLLIVCWFFEWLTNLLRKES